MFSIQRTHHKESVPNHQAPPTPTTTPSTPTEVFTPYQPTFTYTPPQQTTSQQQPIPKQSDPQPLQLVKNLETDIQKIINSIQSS